MPDQEPFNRAPATSGEDAAEQAGNALNEEFKRQVELDQAAARTDARTAGCSPATLAIIGLAIVVIVGLAILILGNIGGASKSSPVLTSAASVPVTNAPSVAGAVATESAAGPSSQATSGASVANLDGDWVLVSGLMNPLTDMPFSCSGCSAYTVTVDPPEASIDISGSTITGGQYKTGFTATLAGDKCAMEEQARIDATVSGGVDPLKDYGTLVIDGTPTAFYGCDAYYNPIPQHGAELGHFTRYLYVKDATMYLCQNLNATLDGCTDANAGGATTDPLASFQR